MYGLEGADNSIITVQYLLLRLTLYVISACMDNHQLVLSEFIRFGTEETVEEFYPPSWVYHHVSVW